MNPNKKLKLEKHTEERQQWSYDDNYYLAIGVDEIKEKLDKYGVAVIPNVLSEQECLEMQQQMWDMLAKLTEKWETPITKDPSTWIHFYKLLPLHSMMFKHWIGHANIMWKLRQHSKIMEVFSQLHNVNTNHLLTSFDGASINLPHEQTNRGFYRGNNWLHMDQAPKRNGKECYQSWVTAFDVHEGDATLSFLEGSHKHHKEFAERFNMKTFDVDWVKIGDNEAQLDFYLNEKGCPRRAIKGSKGMMVVWDSRLIHCGQESMQWREAPNFRFIAYICMMPRMLATPDVLKRRQQLFEEQRMTSHWPHRLNVNGKQPRIYSKDDKVHIDNITPLGKPTNITAVGRRLIGYDN
jgi:ectoine hydroxylase-related dioxygenase (phytanoyl-CoA dioxygenase family)